MLPESKFLKHLLVSMTGIIIKMEHTEQTQLYKLNQKLKQRLENQQHDLFSHISQALRLSQLLSSTNKNFSLTNLLEEHKLFVAKQNKQMFNSMMSLSKSLLNLQTLRQQSKELLTILHKYEQEIPRVRASYIDKQTQLYYGVKKIYEGYDDEYERCKPSKQRVGTINDREKMIQKIKDELVEITKELAEMKIAQQLQQNRLKENNSKTIQSLRDQSIMKLQFNSHNPNHQSFYAQQTSSNFKLSKTALLHRSTQGSSQKQSQNFSALKAYHLKICRQNQREENLLQYYKSYKQVYRLLEKQNKELIAQFNEKYRKIKTKQKINDLESTERLDVSKSPYKMNNQSQNHNDDEQNHDNDEFAIKMKQKNRKRQDFLESIGGIDLGFDDNCNSKTDRSLDSIDI